MSACEKFAGLLHARLDGEIGTAESRELDAHLASCAACRELADSFNAAREALRGMPLEPMPEEDFRAVLDRTIRSGASVAPFRSRLVRRGPVFAGIGLAAAVVGAAILVPLFMARHSGPSPEEIAHAREDVRRALAIAGRALKRAETAGNAVVTDEVSPALRRVPLRWDRLAAESRRNRS